MAYKSVINIDKKNSKKILEELKKKRQQTQYKSASGAQSQANSKNTTSSSSSRRNADGTWKNQTMVTGNYFSSGSKNTYSSTKNNTSSGVKKNTTYNYKDMLKPNFGMSRTKTTQNTSNRLIAEKKGSAKINIDRRAEIANKHKGQDWSAKEGGYINRPQKTNMSKTEALGQTRNESSRKSIGGIDWGKSNAAKQRAGSQNITDLREKGYKKYQEDQKRKQQDMSGLSEQEFDKDVNEFVNNRQINSVDDAFATAGDVSKHLQSTIDDLDKEIEQKSLSVTTSNDPVAANKELADLRSRRDRLTATMNQFKGEARFSEGVQKREWVYDNSEDSEQLAKYGLQGDTYISSVTDEEAAQMLARSYTIGLSEDDTLKAASKFMTEKERKVYGATRIREGDDAAKEYLRYLYDYGDLGQRVTDFISKNIDENTDVNDIAKGFVKYGGSFTSGFGNALEGIADTVNYGIDRDYVHAENIGKKMYAKRKSENPNDIGLDIAFNTGNMMPAIIASVATSGIGAPAAVSAIASSSVVGVSSFGNTYQDARRQGFSADEATSYALVSGISEAALQYALNGVAAVAGGSITESAGKALASSANNAIAKVVKNETAQAILSKLIMAGVGSMGEFEEEYLQAFLDPVFRNAFLGELTTVEPFGEEEIYSGLLGALNAAAMNVPMVAADISRENQIGKQSKGPMGGLTEALNSDLISKLSDDADVKKRATDILDKGVDNVPDGTAGRFMLAYYKAAGVDNEILAFKDGSIDWNTLSDEARTALVTPQNAEYLASYGFKVNENMTPEEMRNAVEQTAKESYAKENRRSFNEFIEDRLSNAQSDEEVNKIKEFAEQNRELYKDTEKATGRKVIIADLGRDTKGNRINGYATADKIVLNSEIANTEDGARFVLGHEITHGTELSKHYNALLDSAKKYYGDKWDAEVENIQKIYSQKSSSFSVAQAEREVVANFVGSKVFTDLESMKAFVRDHKTTARRIMSWLKSKFTNTSGTNNTVLREAYNNFERAFNEIDRSIEGKRATVQYQMNLAQGAQFAIEEDVQARKRNQLDIIQQTNPMHDDYHTGIRSVDDIKSFNEAFNDADSDSAFAYPDWTQKDGQRVVETGRVTVYSSQPIENGSFVSPSKMMAQDYAGSGQVYSKTVKVSSVAWITADEGQFADVSFEDEIAAYTRGDKKRSEMSAKAKEMMVDPKNAEYLANKYGLDISPDMSPKEIEARLSEIAKENREAEKTNFDKWKSITPATRHQSRSLDLTDDRNVARYRQEIDDVVKDPTRRNVMVGMPNEVLLRAGLNKKELIIEADDIIKMVYPEGYMKNNPNQNRHNLGFSAVKNLVYQIAEPVAITENTPEQQVAKKARGKDSIVVFTEWENDDGRIIVPIEIDVTTNTIKLPNKVNTAYGAGESYLNGFDSSKILFPEDTKKDLRALLQESRQPVPESRSDDVFANNIYGDENFVKFNEENDEITGRQKSLSINEVTEGERGAKRVLDNAVEAYGSIKPGENPTREANVPKKTSENRFVSRYARTLYEAAATSDEMIPALDSGIAAEDFSYERIANSKLQKGAETVIKTDGIESARRQWDGVAERSDAATPQDIALGQYLYNEYVKAGDYDNAIQVAIDLAHKATTAGQTVQAFRLLKKLTPDGQLYTLEKLANDYTKQLSKRNIKGFKGIEIDENLAKQLLEAKTKEEIQTARQAIMQNIADQVPATWADKLNAWRYMAMLFNPRTHIRNVVGNAFFVPMRGLKDLIGAGMESAMQRAGKMQQTERTKTVVNPYDKANKALFDKAKESFDENVDIIRGEDKYGKSEIDQKRRIFKSKVLNWIDKFNSAMLEKEDVIFMKKAYVDSYAKAMKARGLTPETMTSAQENEIASYAIKEAQKATYRDANALASALNKFKRSNKFAHILGEGLFPFTKTPLNILKRGIEYSPLGIIKGTYQMLNGVRKGNVSAAEAIDSMSSGISGTGILALGAWLASQGLIKGGQGDDDEAALDSLQGGQSYALVIGDKSYTLDWAAPVAMPLFIGVEMFNSFDKDNEGGANFSRIVDSITKISDPLFNLSMLSSLNSAIDTIKYNEGSSALTEIGINVVTSYAGQFVPTISGQFARIIDPTQRKTFYAKDSNLPKAVDSLWQGAVKKIPGLSMIMQPSVDRWGRDKKTENITERVLENLASPGYYSERSGDDVDKEVDRLYVQIGDAGVIPPAAEKSIKWSNSETKEKGEMNLTAEQYTRYSKRLGELCYNGVQDLIKSNNYKELNDRERADAIAEIYNYAKNIAKNEITDGKYELTKWSQALKENEDVLGDYAVYKTKISGEDMDTKEKRSLLNGMKMSDDVKEQIYRASFSDSDIETLDEALTGGASFNQFLTFKVGTDKIDDSKSKTKSIDKKELLLSSVKDEKAQSALWKTFFETENTQANKTLDYAVEHGVDSMDFIKASVEFSKIENIDVKEGDYSRTIQKKQWLAKNIKDEKSLETLYTMKLEDAGTEEDKTIGYAVRYGVKASNFIKREIQKADEHGDKSGQTKENYRIENGQITSETSDKYISGSKLIKSAHNLLNSGYSDKEIEYFYQKEYSSDDDFVWMVGAGLTPKQYIEYIEKTATITADKDKNGNSINGSKKIKMFNAINSMKLTKLQKMLLFMTDYKMTKDQYRAIFQYINSLSMSRDEKLALAAGLGFTVENGRVLL